MALKNLLHCFEGLRPSLINTALSGHGAFERFRVNLKTSCVNRGIRQRRGRARSKLFGNEIGRFYKPRWRSEIAHFQMWHRWLQEYAYHINAGWWVYALAALIASGIALLTISYQTFHFGKGKSGEKPAV